MGLCAALAARGLVVQPFKKGPDYIDPSWLTEAAGRACRNLDLFLMGRETVVAALRRGRAPGRPTSPWSRGPWASTMAWTWRARQHGGRGPLAEAPVLLVVDASA